MWPFLPKKCNCTETPNNPGTSCNHSGLTSSDLIYEGIAGECSGITPGMTASEILQQLSYFLCSIELTQYILNFIEDNPEEFPEFIELVNGVISCETIDACGPVPTTTTTTTVEPTTTTTTSSSSTTTTTSSSSSTTTTTTTVADACVTYTLQALVNNASWIATTCAFARTGGVIPLAGNTVVTPCIINNTLVLTQAVIVNETECTTTTTTTAAPTTTTTSSTTIAPTTTTTTSTTVEPLPCVSVYVFALDANETSFTYYPCTGGSASYTLSTNPGSEYPAAMTVCCYPGTPITYNPVHIDIEIQGDC
jgi:hypothetical protein